MRASRQASRSAGRLRLGLALGFVVALTAAGCGGPAASRTPGSPTSAPGTTVAPASTGPTLTTTPTTVPPGSPALAGTWQLLPQAPLSGEMYQQEGVWDGTDMLIAGRVTLNDPPYVRDVLAAYDPAPDTWTTLTGGPGPEGNYEGGDRAVWTGKEMLLWGVTNTAYKPATKTWRKLPEPPAGGGGPSVIVWTGTQMIGWGGGCCGESYADGAAYTPATNTWKKLPAAPLSGRHAMGAWTGTEMLVFGGDADHPDNGTTGVSADGAAYEPVTRSWRKLPPMPVPRAGGQVVWDGTEVLVVGGSGKGPAFRAIARGVAYNPTTNRWRWLAPMRFPRQGHVAVWTGSRLLVWGGLTKTGTQPHGEAYDPATDTWSALPKAPLKGRSYAIVVWTGVRMVVWGGQTDQGVRLDGAWYKPA